MSGYGGAQVDNQLRECEVHSTPGEGSLRLVDVKGAPHSGANGTLQVYINGRWGGFCGLISNYNRESLDVMCRQLGYRTWTSNGWSMISGWTMHITDISCSGVEDNVFGCQYGNTSISQCGNTYLFINCNPDIFAETMYGSVTISDTIEVAGVLFVGGSKGFGPICDEDFDLVEGGVACRQMGYKRVQIVSRGLYYDGTIASPAVTHITCEGNERHLLSCNHSRDSARLCHNYARVHCTANAPDTAHGSVRLVCGVLEMSLDGRWWAVPSLLFSTAAANVACRQLEFPSGAVGYTSGQIQDSGVANTVGAFWCTGSEQHLFDCLHSPPVYRSCQTSVILKCEFVLVPSPTSTPPPLNQYPSILPSISIPGYESIDGGNFYLPFCKTPSKLQLLVTTDMCEPFNIVISEYGQFYNQYRISRGKLLFINIQSEWAINCSNPGKNATAIRIQSQDDKDINVIRVHVGQNQSINGVLVFPKIETISRAYEYFALSASKKHSETNGSFIGFVTTETNTTVTLTVVTNTTMLFGNISLLVEGNSYTDTIVEEGLSSVGTAHSDLSGTRLISDKPVTFVTGPECGFYLRDPMNCNDMLMHIPPTETWGFKFFLVPLSTHSADGYRILASRGGTECSVTCTNASLSENITLANPGDFKQLIYTTRYCSVECSQPVLIFQFNPNPEFIEDYQLRPYTMMIPPVGQYSRKYDLIFVEYGEYTTLREPVDAWINIAILSEYDADGLRLNGKSLSLLNRTEIRCHNNKVCATIVQYNQIFNSTYHRLEHVEYDAMFTASVYGWRRTDVYGFVGNLNFNSIAVEIFCLKYQKSTAQESEGVATFVLTRTGAATNRSCIGYTIVDVSTQGLADYRNISAECCLDAGSRESVCEVPLVVDSITEGEERMIIRLAPSKEQLVCESPGTSTEITIIETFTLGNFSTKGSEFHILFGPNSGSVLDTQILVTTDESEPVNFWVFWDKRTSPKTKSNTTHTVSRGKVVLIDIPRVLSINMICPPTPDIGIQLQSQDGKQLTVVGVNEMLFSTDAFLVFPKIETKSKTYEYFALSADRGPFQNMKSFFGFVTTEHDTKITITPVTRIDTIFVKFLVFDSGRNYTETIPAAGTSVAGTASSDISGTRIVSDKPLSFFSGHQCGLIFSDSSVDCSHLVEQVPPTETWGFKFFLVPLSTRSADGYRILACRGGTECSVSCSCTDASLSENITLANPGDFKQLIYKTRYCSVECNRPVLIFQFSLGYTYDEVARSAPFAVMIPPVGQYSNNYNLVFFESKDLDTQGEQVVFEAWINIAIPADHDPSGLRFDGSPLCGVRFVDVYCNDGKVCGRVAQYNLTSDTGSHKLEHINPDARFIATVYGWERHNSYGYVGGMKFDSIAAEGFCFKNDTYVASESDRNTSFVVIRTGAVTDRSCIGYNITDVSTQGSSDNVLHNKECCFEAGKREARCEIPLPVDSFTEADKVLRIELTPHSGQFVCDVPGNTAVITILDSSGDVTIRFEYSSYYTYESVGVFLGIRLVVSNPFANDASVKISFKDITAKGGSDVKDEGIDYRNTPVVVTFEAGSNFSNYASIPIALDNIQESDEIFKATFELPDGYRNLNKTDPVDVNITIEDENQGELASIGTIENDGTVLITAIVVGIVAVIAVSTLLACLLLLCVKKRHGPFRKKATVRMRAKLAINSTMETNFSLVVDEWEMKHSDLELQGHLGKGQFGDVVLAFLKSTSCTSKVKSYIDRMVMQGDSLSTSKTVAVKYLKDSQRSQENMNLFLREIELMKRVSATGNNHIVQIIGCILSDPPAMVMEYVPFGDLRSNLVQWKEQLKTGRTLVDNPRYHDNYSYSRESLEESDLWSFAHQIAIGMRFLSSLNVIHRDLACRNVLVGNGKLLKISDFGLSKEIDGLYASSTNTRLPIRWMSPEAITHRLFSEKSDIWSYGVCLWEICTLGEVPYGCISNPEVAKAIAASVLLERPQTCSDEIYDLMLRCWKMESSNRPTFLEIKDYLEGLIENNMSNAYYLALPVDPFLDGNPTTTATLEGTIRSEMTGDEDQDTLGLELIFSGADY